MLMLSSPKTDDSQRARLLERSEPLESTSEPDYDGLVRLAAELCETPIALISLMDRERQGFKASVGLYGVSSAERGMSLCAPGLECKGLLIVEDTRADERFATHPLVVGPPYLRFYAGVTLLGEEGQVLGILCVADSRPRTLGESQRQSLVTLARQVELMVRLRGQVRRMKERHAEMERAQERLRSLNTYLQAEMRERQRVERELLEQQELLTSVLANIPHSVFWKDRNSVVLGGNQQFARDLGFSSPEELVGRTDYELNLTLEQADQFRRDDRAVMESGIPKLSFEEPLRRADGEDTWVITNKVPLRHPDGTVKGLVGIYEDISERRRQQAVLQDAKRVIEQHAEQLEAQVAEAQERTRYLMEHSGEAAFVLDAGGFVLETNPVAERLLGVKREQLRGTLFESLATEGEREPLRQALRALWVRGTVRLDNQGLRSNSGARVALGMAASLQVTGETHQLLVVGHDLTEKLRVEQQGIQNDRLASMGALAAGIAHEINNPTAYVLSNLAFLQEWRTELEQTLAALPGVPEETRQSLAEVKDVLAECLVGSGRIRDIVRDMRFFSHTGGEQLTPVDIRACLDVVLRMAHNELKHTARLERDYAEGLPPVHASEGRLSQVFLNLVINAVQAMRSKDSASNVLRVSAVREERWVRVEVSDTGSGIRPEVLPRIFEPFFTTKPAGLGTGLGLSISQSILQKMGGEMSVRSALGQGTTFTLRLPVSDLELDGGLPG